MSILNYKGYQGCFSYDPEADIFHGEVLHLTDVITFQGRSVDELKQALADSVEDYLEFCAQKGKIPEEPYSGRFNVQIAPKVHQCIALEAGRDDITIHSSLKLSQAPTQRRECMLERFRKS
ncbi:MAG: type II toxin-antitoxin system HicB family antitoxin [Desulfovibrionaceae bacterium]|nr:type II toxin-antitoxin system HicB family antitoxin [Desulfovibrionaceae bacterium]